MLFNRAMTLFVTRPVRPTRLLRLACLALGLGLWSLSAQAEALHARYGVSLLGLPLGKASLDGEVAGQTYKIAINARLTGIASVVSSSKGAAVASGAFLRGLIVPSAYANTSANATQTRTVRVAMSGGSVKGVDISPPIDPSPERVPLTDAHTRNIVDPLSAMIMPVPGTEPIMGPAACNRTIPVYDGFTRFDVTLTYIGQRQVKAKGYAGPVSVCAVRYTPIAGHRNRKPVQFMAQNKDIEVWLAPVGANRVLVPFRISMATMIGHLNIEADEFSAAAKAAP
jgi:hypothetical protein